ncbi:MAG: hypothetical protein H6601_01850 [Flavobacteriales bacterium]|nr:hypothetical protein [Flavobacteriales bacterium]
MKKILIPLFVSAIAIGASSCKKCAECECTVLGDHDFCMEDFDSKDQYEAAIANFEASGCDCTEKLK